jgi:HEAT repeats
MVPEVLMSRRRLLRAVLLLAVVLVGALHSPGVRWRLWGWLHGEAFHRGRPTSYWAGRMRGNQRALVSEDMDPAGPAVRVYLAVSAPPWAPWENALRLRLGLSEVPPEEVLLDGHDSASAVPVLITLFKDDDPQVHDAAAFCLSILGPESRKAVPALVGALKDDDANVRAAAAQALKRIDPQAAGH